jgi:hypothetical protein
LRFELQRPTSPPRTARPGYSGRDFKELPPLLCCALLSAILLLVRE